MRILTWAESGTPQLKRDFETIFFTCSSRKTFASAEEKTKFLHRWTAYYFDHCPEEVFFAIDDNGETMGYLSGCSDSETAKAKIAEELPSFLVFEKEFRNFPAHLHINFAPKFQGQGIGQKLIEHYCHFLQARAVKGVHIVTSPGARNRGFYARLGFTHEQISQWREHPMLFMGKKL